MLIINQLVKILKTVYVVSMIDIRELSKIFCLPDNVIYKYLLQHSNRINYKILTEVDYKTHIQDNAFNEIKEAYQALSNLIIPLQNIIDLSVKTQPEYTKPVIYFLLSDNELRYIGQTVNLGQRLYDHKRNKEFNSIYIMPCYKVDLNRTEAINVNFHKPQLNAHYFDNKQIFKFVLKACCLQ